MSLSKYIAGVFLLLMAVAVQAQEDDKPAPYKRPSDTYNRDTVSNDGSKLKTFQPAKKKVDMSNFLIEPNVQLFFGPDQVQFGLMPSLGYKVYKNLYAGGSICYNLLYITHVDGTSGSPSASQQVYGGGPFLHYKIWKGFFARMRFEMLAVRYPNVYENPNLTYQINYATIGIPYIWIGAGYNLTPARNIFIPLAVYVNPLWGAYNGSAKEYSPYSWFYFQVAFYIFSPNH